VGALFEPSPCFFLGGARLHHPHTILAVARHFLDDAKPVIPTRVLSRSSGAHSRDPVAHPENHEGLAVASLLRRIALRDA